MTPTKNPTCPNRYCQGGVITRDGHSGVLCKYCNPDSTAPKGLPLKEIQLELRYIYSFRNLSRGDRFEIIGCWLTYLHKPDVIKHVLSQLTNNYHKCSWDGYESVKDYMAYLKHRLGIQ